MNIDRLGINNVLRYFFSGAIFLAAAGYGFGIAELKSKIEEVSGGVAALLSLLALLIGATIYVVYRAVLYTILSRVSAWLAVNWVSGWSDKTMRRCPVALAVPENEFKIDTWRWKLADAGESGAVPAHRTIAEWGSHIHFCYTAGISISVGSITGAQIARVMYEATIGWSCLLIVAFGLINLVGMISHIRLKHIEYRLHGIPPKAESGRSRV